MIIAREHNFVGRKETKNSSVKEEKGPTITMQKLNKQKKKCRLLDQLLSTLLNATGICSNCWQFELWIVHMNNANYSNNNDNDNDSSKNNKQIQKITVTLKREMILMTRIWKSLWRELVFKKVLFKNGTFLEKTAIAFN